MRRATHPTDCKLCTVKGAGDHIYIPRESTVGQSGPGFTGSSPLPKSATTGIRTQTKVLSVRAYTREDAERKALAKAFAEWPDKDGIAGPWGLASTPELMTAPEGFEALFRNADLTNLYRVVVVRVVKLGISAETSRLVMRQEAARRAGF